jgi:hypothetical protein
MPVGDENSYKILFAKPEGYRLLRGLRRRWERFVMKWILSKL